MKAVAALTILALLLAWGGYTLARSAAANPFDGRDLVGWVLMLLAVILLLVAAGAAIHWKGP